MKQRVMKKCFIFHNTNDKTQDLKDKGEKIMKCENSLGREKGDMEDKYLQYPYGPE